VSRSNKRIGTKTKKISAPLTRGRSYKRFRSLIGATACAACHGANGVSVSEVTPNLAAQRAGYLAAQLKAYKDGARKLPGGTSPTAIMSAMATQLSADDIANVAAYFASLPGAAPGAKSDLLANVAKTSVTFPEDYKQTFTKYHTINFPTTKQVRYFYANPVAVSAAKAGKSLPVGTAYGQNIGLRSPNHSCRLLVVIA
jgi:cytochrome c553